MQWWFFIVAALAGTVGQLIDATTGMGFGAISSTTLIAAGGSTAMVVAAINVAKITSGFVSGFTHWKLGNVRTYWLTPLAVTGVVGGITGALLLTFAPEGLSQKVTPWLLIFMALLILRRYLLSRREARKRTISGGATSEATTETIEQPSRFQRFYMKARHLTRIGMSAIGFTSGFLNAWTGAYGPFATSAVLLLQTGHPRYVVGTVNAAEVFVAAAISVTILIRLGMDQDAWILAGALTLGSLITAPVGAMLVKRLQAKSLGLFIAIVLISVNAFTLYKAYLQ